MVKVQKRLSQELDKYNPSEHQWHVNEGCKIMLSKTQPLHGDLHATPALCFPPAGFPSQCVQQRKESSFLFRYFTYPLISLFSSFICPPALPKEQDGQIILLFASVSPPISLTGKGPPCPKCSSVLRDSAQSL